MTQRPMRWDRIAKVAGLLFVLVVVAATAFAGEVVATRVSLSKGEKLMYVDVSGREWCATFASLYEGPGGILWVWATIDADPRRIVRVQVSELRQGCKQ